MERRPIRALPEASVRGLRSSTAITCMSQAVEELVANAIDAGATEIDVSVRAEGGWCSVCDNGRGMDAGDLALVGGRYSTSKIAGLDDLATASTLGYRGEALASLGEVATLSLHTRAAGGGSCALEKWIQAGATLSVGRSAKPRQVGTTVTVRDLFGNYPVRRRALHLDARKELQRIKAQLTRFALAHCTLAFSLYDSQRGCTALQTRGVPDALSCFGHLFGAPQAGKLASLDSLDSPSAVSTCAVGGRSSERGTIGDGRASALRLRGLLSKPGAGYHSKELQYLCAGASFPFALALALRRSALHLITPRPARPPALACVPRGPCPWWRPRASAFDLAGDSLALPVIVCVCGVTGWRRFVNQR
jgi:DNA mismatch repair protein MutL